LDGCIDENGNIEPWAGEVVQILSSYTEKSPSGRGIHTIVKGTLPNGSRQKDFGDREHHGIALYDATSGHYLTITGLAINSNGAIMERTPELLQVHARFFHPEAKRTQREQRIQRRPCAQSASDHDLIARARAARDGGKFSRLWDGQWEGPYPSPSEADLALCAKLAFWTACDASRIDALFRQSGLMRDKWERDDYRKRTIDKAIEQTTETWQGARRTWR
jgi:putative DNA primase/helicase